MAQTYNSSRSPSRTGSDPQAGRLACCRAAGELLAPDFFKALCDPTRLGVLLRLAELGRPSTVSEVAGCCPVDLSVVSRHLAALRRAGIVESERRGKEVLYRVLYSRLAATLRRMADAIEACCPPGESPTEGGCCPPPPPQESKENAS